MRSAVFSVAFVLALVAGCSEPRVCRPGRGCGSDGGDAGATCALRCGPRGACCAVGDECSAGRCVPACAHARCGVDGALCCGAGEVCAGDRCASLGAPCTVDADCAEEQFCEPLAGRCLHAPERAECTGPPPFAVVPVERWMVPGNAIATPLVVSLTDDDGNGRIDADDVPDVVVSLSTSPGGSDARLTALSGDDGRVLWRSKEVTMWFNTPAAGDLDGDGTLEIVTLISGIPEPRLAIYSHTGELVRAVSSLDVPYAYTLADLDADGRSEIIGTSVVYESDGTRRFDMPEMLFVPAVLDVDGDGRQDVVGRDAAYDGRGRRIWGRDPFDVNYDIVAVGRVLAGVEGPQIVSVGGAGELSVIDPATGDFLLGPTPIPGAARSTGAPTIADFDGDSSADIGVLTADAYVVLDLTLPAPHVLWSSPVHDASGGSAGSTVFDFNGDGTPEVVFHHECALEVRSGADGELLWSTPSSTGTLLEQPIVADVSGDRHADLVVVTNDVVLPSCAAAIAPGVRVYHDASERWMVARPLWNQHAYHVDNIADDGSIPPRDGRGWSRHNTYRVNLAEGGGAARPNLVVAALRGDASACPSSVSLSARVENQGTRGVPAGVEVAFHTGTVDAPGTLLGVGRTTRDLVPGDGEWVRIDVGDPPLDGEGLTFHAVVDERGGVAECVEHDNTVESVSLACAPLM